jgi:hypothetical protein
MLKTALRRCWNADEPLEEIPFEQTALLATEKYVLDEWNFKF